MRMNKITESLYNKYINEDTINQLGDPVGEFISSLHTYDIVDIDIHRFKAAYNKMFEEYANFPSSSHGLDVSLNADKRRFYDKYIQFANVCSGILKTASPGSGYGPEGLKQVKLYSMLKNVVNEFPYGWKYL